MKTIELSLARIGNSRGIRLPAELIRKHALEPGIILEDRGDELVLRPKGGRKMLSWAETAREMAESSEDLSDWDNTLADGLDGIPWDTGTSGLKSAATAKSTIRSRRKS